MIGRTLAHYRILEKLGAGGMGEVYRAQDTKLGRDVAIKILPAGFAQDPERLARFEREARLLASLNHPNIAAIYGLEESEGTRFLVLELVPGETLSGPLHIEEALPICRQIAEALEEAHEKGIVHRDLKPANVKVTPDGKVKVLDFGLAKAAEPEQNTADSATLTAAATRAGVILGTAAYMSPEQARGKPVDKRTDIWAFGCILYELLAGKQAFGGETISDCMVAVLSREPDWSSLPADTPAGLDRLLRRCLQKDPKHRLRDIADADLDMEEGPAGPTAPSPRPRVSLSPRLFLTAVVLVLAAFVAGVWWHVSRTPPVMQWSGELLGGSTIAWGPRVSPDGQLLAFQPMVDGMTQVAVMKPASGNWAVLTHNRSRGGVQDLCWSRDGTKIYFGRFLDVPNGVFSVPVLGGEERLVLEDASTPQVLPDGSLLVIRINAERKFQLHHFWPESGRLQPLGAESQSANPARVFPDGKEAVVFGKLLEGQPDAREHLYVIDLASGRARLLDSGPSLQQGYVGFPLAVTPDGRSVLTDLPSGSLHRIVAIPRDGSGSRRTLVTLTLVPWWIDAASDGSLYLDQVDRPAEVARFSISGGSPDVLASSATYRTEQAIPFPDGRILFGSQAAGRDRLLVLEPGKDPVPFVDTQEDTTVPATLVGEREVAFLAGAPPNQTIAVASIADGRIVRRLEGSKGRAIESLASSPDGKTLYFAGSGAVWAIPATDGESRKVHAGDAVAVDPRGPDLIIQLIEKDGVRLVRMPLRGGPERPIRVRSGFHLAPFPMGPNAVGRDGRILLQMTAKDRWFWRDALLDPETGRLEEVPVRYEGDLVRPGWTGDGRIVAMGSPLRSSIWRFRPLGAKP